jgi:hypothetical protein
MTVDDANKTVRISNLGKGAYNPFGADAAELLAAALDEAGLLEPETTFDGRTAEVPLQSYFRKRTQYREVSRLGTLLVQNGIVSQDDLGKALSLQREHPGMKLGKAMTELGLCSVNEIERHLDTQLDIRKDMKDLELFRKNIDSIKKRLRAHF